ncbi:MAG TPA: mannonate dehydratase [Bryobacteraceae bacterium]|nr:mannonate dehydratase [Bryobacteraceae bacterium]
MERRQFVRIGMASAGGALLRYAAAQSQAPEGIKLGTMFTDRPGENDLALLRHAGVEAVSIWTSIENNSAEWMIGMRKKLEANGVQVYNFGILDLHCDPVMVLGLPGVETKIEQYKTYLGNLGRAGIHYTTYAHISNIKNQPTPGFYQTSVGKTRGDANTREFDLAVAQKLPCTFDKEYQEEQIWKTFTTFIRAVMPVAEKNKVRIGLHPDDPPVASLGCVARVFRTYAAYERAFQLADSDNFGVCLCIGTWAEGGKPAFGKDPVEAVRAFGAKKRIFKVHFRNVNSTLPRFRETFVDNGYLDMYQVMKALRDVKFDGIVVPDHVPGGGYPAVNNSYTIGYMKALRDRVNAEARRV